MNGIHWAGCDEEDGSSTKYPHRNIHSHESTAPCRKCIVYFLLAPASILPLVPPHPHLVSLTTNRDAYQVSEFFALVAPCHDVVKELSLVHHGGLVRWVKENKTAADIGQSLQGGHPLTETEASRTSVSLTTNQGFAFRWCRVSALSCKAFDSLRSFACTLLNVSSSWDLLFLYILDWHCYSERAWLTHRS